MTPYKGIEVYKLTCWTQGPVMLQALNLLENLDVQPMGYNSARYLHAIYQVMNLAFADRDFYYGDPDFPPVEPIRGLLSKEYAKQRAGQINWIATTRPSLPATLIRSKVRPTLSPPCWRNGPSAPLPNQPRHRRRRR